MLHPSERPVHAPHGDRAATLRRIPSLDGIRAVSILMVMGLHTLQQYNVPAHGLPLALYVVFNGALGVNIFFVLSGYLISRLLLQEFTLRGAVDLARFYLKRALRILPPVYVYLAVLAVIAGLGLLALPRIDLFSTLFFFHDYTLGSSWAVSHLWSLSVEEQFYVLWPFILVLFLRSSRTHGRRRATIFCVAVIVCSPLLRVVAFRLPQPHLHHGTAFHMYADLLLFGALAALAEGTAAFERLFRALTRIPLLPLLALAGASALDVRFQNYWEFLFGRTCEGALVLALMLWCVRNPHSLPGHLLNSRVLTHIGLLSYSLYIWQTLFLNQNAPALFRQFAGITRAPWSWLIVFALAELSFRLVERPSQHLRNLLLYRAASQTVHLERSTHPLRQGSD